MKARSLFSAISTFLFLAAFPIAVSAQSGTGLQKTPQGIPWYVASQQSHYSGAEAAARIASSKWRGQWAAKIESGRISGKFRLVTVNGATYLVIAKIREPLLLNAHKRQELHKNLVRSAAGKAGCTPHKNILVKRSKHQEVEKMAVQVQCSFL